MHRYNQIYFKAFNHFTQRRVSAESVKSMHQLPIPIVPPIARVTNQVQEKSEHSSETSGVGSSRGTPENADHMCRKLNTPPRFIAG